MEDRNAPFAGTLLTGSRAPGGGAIACVSLVVLMSSIGTSIANIALPALVTAFNATFQQVQWVVLAYLVATTSLVVSAGRLGDILGRRRLLLAGLLLFTTASFLCGVAPTLQTLIIARGIQGVGAAIMMALALAMARDATPDGRVGQAMGLVAAMSAIGTAIGPALGGLLLGFGGWRAVFLILVPVGAAATLAGYRHLPRATVDNRGPGTGFDKLGALLLTASVSAFALSVTLGGGNFGPGNLALLIAAASGFALFGVVEARASTPLVRLAYLRDKVLSAALAANLVVSAVMMSTLVVGPFYLASVLGLGSLGIGLAMSAGPSLVAILGFPAGQIADRFGGERTSLAGLAVMAAGSLTLVLAPVSSGLAGYLIPVAVITIGYALFQTSNNMIVMLRAARAESGAVAGLLNLSRNLGLISGAAVMGTVFARASGAAELSHALPEAISAGMRTSFTVAGVLVAAAFVLTVLVGRRGTEAVGLG